jgi:Xaa-Pro aminopeptidase
VEKNALKQRRSAVVREFRARKVDCFLVTGLPNVRYLSGFTGSNALLLLWEGGELLFTDPRYGIQAAQESDCRLRVARGGLMEEALKSVRRRKFRRVGFEPRRLLYADYETLRCGLRLGAQPVPVSGWVEEHRMVKSRGEIEAIRAAVRLNSSAFEAALRRYRTGMREVELAAEIDHQMRRLGAESPAFDTIVASGARAALPHAKPTQAPIEPGTVLLIDMGARVNGYVSDMTRTLFAGGAPKKLLAHYRAVLDAQLAGLAAVREGATARQVDAACRRELKKHGLADLFVHSTGHGLGLEIHEAPRLAKQTALALRAGMVVTIEPGIYKEGFCGIRIEDTVVVTQNGCEILTPTSKEPLAV